MELEKMKAEARRRMLLIDEWRDFVNGRLNSWTQPKEGSTDIKIIEEFDNGIRYFSKPAKAYGVRLSLPFPEADDFIVQDAFKRAEDMGYYPYHAIYHETPNGTLLTLMVVQPDESTWEEEDYHIGRFQATCLSGQPLAGEFHEGLVSLCKSNGGMTRTY